MRRIKNILKSLRLPSLWEGMGVGFVLFFTLTSCSSDQDEPEVKQTPIAFSANQQEEEVTRAATPLSDYLTSFRVWGIKNMDTEYTTYQTVMEDYSVWYANQSAGSNTTNTQGWDYILTAYPNQTPKYWDFEAKAYRFFAVTGETTVTKATDGTVYVASFAADATNPDKCPFYSKLWFSNNSGDYGKPVTLQFMQPFAKVRFLVVLADPSKPLDLKNDDFRPTTTGKSIVKKAAVTITYPMKDNGTTEEFAIVENSVTQTLGSFNQRWTETSPIWETVIPVTNQGSYTYKITVDGEEKSCVVPAQYMQWLPGYSYTYIFKVSGEGGVELATVRTSFTDWNDGENREYSLFNW